MSTDPGQIRQGVLFAATGYFVWGFYGLFFKQLQNVNPLEIVAQRAFWSLPIAGLILFALGRTGDIATAFSNPAILRKLCLSSLFIGITWGIFVWAIVSGRTLETSLGFYIAPLLSALIGAVVLGERFSSAQKLALGIALVAVTIPIVMVGDVPWVSFALASCFAGYAYMRKTVNVGPVQGFFVEMVLLSAIGAAIVNYLGHLGEVRFLTNTTDTLWLMACGPITAGPLILFAAAARRLNLSLVGILQYIAPTMFFLTAVLVFEEPAGFWRLTTFVLVWIAVAIFSTSALLMEKRV